MALWWLGAVLPLIAFAAIGVTAFTVVRTVRARRWLALAVALVPIPPTVVGAMAAVSYARGEARLLTSGLPHVTLYNVDRETRVQRASSGCIVDGTEWVYHGPNNLTVRALTGVIGPMPGAYAGPYPTDAEAQAAGEAGALLDERLAAGAPPIALSAGIEKTLRTSLERGDTLRAALWQERVLVVHVTRPAPEHLRTLDPDGTSAQILIDAESGRVVAYLGTVSMLPAGLPVPWR